MAVKEELTVLWKALWSVTYDIKYTYQYTGNHSVYIYFTKK